MTTDFSSDLDPINANWAVFTSAYGYGSIGSAMTEASGLFTFPVTGIWQIFFCADFKISAAENRYVNATINTTTDNSTYTRATQQRGSMYADSSNFVYETVRTDFIFDVTESFFAFGVVLALLLAPLADSFRDAIETLGQLAEPIVEAGWEDAQQAVERLRGQKSAALERIESLAQKLGGLESDPPERNGSSASRW